jgi:hypothetical protein
MASNRNALLSDLKQTKDALRASEKRGRKAVRQMRAVEKVFTGLIPKLENWTSLPLSDEAPCRAITTGEARQILTLLKGGLDTPDTNEADEEKDAAE